MSISSRIRDIKARSVQATTLPAKAGTGVKLSRGNSWVSREQPGKRVDHLRRDDETEPNPARRRSPSN